MPILSLIYLKLFMLQETHAKRKTNNLLKTLGGFWDKIRSHVPWQPMVTGATSAATGYALTKAMNGQQKRDDKGERAADQDAMLQGLALLEREIDEQLHKPVERVSNSL